MKRAYIAVACAVAALLIGTAPTKAQQESPSSSVGRESLSDAWWTGPIMAASGATLPRGHSLIEPYLYDDLGAHSNSLGSSSYILYGLANGLTVGSIPAEGYNKLGKGQNSSKIGLGDVTLLTQHQLTQFHPGRWVPTSGLVVEETLPTGKYDNLGSRPGNGLGAGAFTTMLGLYPQTYFWLPNGRILRMRFDVSQAYSSNATVQGVSVYGTAAGFSGHAKPGSSFLANPAWEYSVTRNWVLALDAAYRHSWSTRVVGQNAPRLGGAGTPTNVRLNSGSSEEFAFAPAVEYNFNSSLGIIAGTRIIPASHNTTGSLTPVIAINFVR